MSVDPPPDLALEVEITSDAIDKLPIYADLGVPEGCAFKGGKSTPGPIEKDRWYEISLLVTRIRSRSSETF